MAESNVFEKIKTLVDMQQDLGQAALNQLRGAHPDPRSRIDRIWEHPPLDYEGGVHSTGGNSNVFTMNADNERVERFVSGTRALYLGHTRDDHQVAIYPFGIVGLTEAGQPIFEDPENPKQVSVVIEYDGLANKQWLQRSVSPLFNIGPEGNVHARLTDEPTPAELQLLHDILETFEETVTAE